MNSTLAIGDAVFVQGYDWNARIIKELDNDMIYVTTPDGLGRDVHKTHIRDHLFGDILNEFPENKSVIIVTDYRDGIISQVFHDSCYVKFPCGNGRDFPLCNLKKKSSLGIEPK